MATLAAERQSGISIDSVADKVYAGERLTPDDAIFLFNHPNPLDLASLANFQRQRKVPGDTVTYIIGRILNYTNVCWVRCKFCAFYRVPGHDEGYVHSDGAILDKVRDTVEKGGVEILFQGGLNPKLKIDYYENIFGKIKEAYPDVILHALSPAEIIYIAHISKLTLHDTLMRLNAAGLHSIPGAGGEILVDRVRKIIAPYKDTTDEWLECMRTASALGIRSTASMMFGHVETLEDRVEHLGRNRDLQDECAPFRAFITWNFQPEETNLPIPNKASGLDYLKTVAVSRLFLDNFDNVQVSILTQGPKIAQSAPRLRRQRFRLRNDRRKRSLRRRQQIHPKPRRVRRLIQGAGYRAQRRNTRYEAI